MLVYCSYNLLYNLNCKKKIYMFIVVLFRVFYVFDFIKLIVWIWLLYIYLFISIFFIIVFFKLIGLWKFYFYICVFLYMNIYGGDWFVNVGVNVFVD